MCGIAGIVGKFNMQEGQYCVENMANSLAHRGPNDGAEWVRAGIALAHRRLSIIDLSDAGRQPMQSACGRYVIVFNGEIYNHSTIRLELGVNNWRSSSDTETLLLAIEKWGVAKTLKRITGMFAFGLWDCERNELTLVRDRLGEKPLYYGWVGDSFVFSSELKALKKHPNWRDEIDRNALASYMQYGYVPTPFSIYQGISKLIPGTFLTILFPSSPATQLNPEAYWSASQIIDQPVKIRNDGEAIDQLEMILERTIGQQMLADVPLGAFLSGGIDSSTIVALMQKQTQEPVKTFSIGFSEQNHNEAEHARAVASHLKTEHTEFYLTAAESLAVIPILPNIYDEPFGDSSAIPTYLVSQLAKQQVTVALSGDGGDELFGGYNRYTWGETIWKYASKIPGGIRRLTSLGITSISPASWDSLSEFSLWAVPKRYQIRDVGDKLHKIAGIVDSSSAEDFYKRLISQYRKKDFLVKGGSIIPNWADKECQKINELEFVERMMFQDMVSYLPDDILVKVDRASMATSLETRAPFLDHHIVEFAWGLPRSMRLREGYSKWLLRQVLYRHVPKKLIDRPKQGFSLPLDVWLRGPLRKWAEDLLDESRLQEQGYLDHIVVKKKWQEHVSGRRNWQHWLWNVLMWQAWLEKKVGS